MPEQLLNRPDIITILQQVGRKRMTQRIIILLTNSLPRGSTTDIIPFMEQKSK